ncbi:MAG TPA: GNAT family protein [Ktedonosporobacter sp.]|nr:GNAT family protein [Ktedonosporobacter sp.]
MDDSPGPPRVLKIDRESELRLLSERDAPLLFALIDHNRAHLRRWLPWVDFTQTLEDEANFVRGLLVQYESSPGYVIWHKRMVAGMISFHPIDWANRKVEIGYWLGESFQGKGLMTRACQLMIAYAFEVLQLNKVEIRCATGNRSSCAIPQRLGFTREGVIRQGEWLYDHFVDLVLYGLLVNEWRQRRTL